jgi:GDP-L-fucose synthase
MHSESRIFVAGHRGLVGSAIVRRLRAAGFNNLLLTDRHTLDLTRQSDVETYFSEQRPEYVFDAAAKVGGIHANDAYPAEFMHNNLAIQTNLIEAAYRHDARKFLFLGSSCVYPRMAPQPMNEDCLLTGPLEVTNQWYAVAKIAGLKMCQAYRRQYGFNAISLMPTNLYGPGDNFHPLNSHVLPALLRKFHEAKMAGEKSVQAWGSGRPRREFLHVDDMADACVFLMQHYDDEQLINIGWGEDVSIAELAALIGRVVGFSGELHFDATKPDGTPRKLLDTTRLKALGWKPRIALEEGVRTTYEWYRSNKE